MLGEKAYITWLISLILLILHCGELSMTNHLVASRYGTKSIGIMDYDQQRPSREVQATQRSEATGSNG
jgi:hypothetical protein